MRSGFFTQQLFKPQKKILNGTFESVHEINFFGHKTSFEAYESVTKIQVERNDPIFLFDIHDFTLQ